MAGKIVLCRKITEDPRLSRRAVVAGLFAASAATPSAADVADPRDRVRRAADALAASMKALHGGQWSVRISHDHGYAAVSRDL
jgi:uncharacterized protein (DUF2141 family)